MELTIEKIAPIRVLKTFHSYYIYNTRTGYLIRTKDPDTLEEHIEKIKWLHEYINRKTRVKVKSRKHEFEVIHSPTS